MPNINPVGQVEGALINNFLGRTGIPFLPSFYNSNYSNPAQGFRNSEAARIAQGDRRALGQYAGRQGGRIVGGLLGGPLGALAGGWLGPHLVNLASGNGWSGNATPSVTVGDIIPMSNYTPQFDGLGSLQYQGQPQIGPAIPDFSNYSNDLLGQQPTDDDRSPSGGYNYSGPGYVPSGGGFQGNLNWGGGTSGAMLSNLGLASGVMNFGGFGGSPTNMNNLDMQFLPG